ncbi:MAG: asparaginase [Heliobacteriaceae bacterium]|jgi:L-asparaginase II|nr:asparaginase [Heliobacteriaceae bacterium]
MYSSLVKYIRDGLVEQEHFGFIVLANKEKVIERIGEDHDYPYFLRSCAKPLQASLAADYGLDFTPEEIALCCASHAGEEIHVEIARNFLKRTGVKESDLKCGLHRPLSKSVPAGQETVFHNNCIGKHIMMLAICALNGWDLGTYYEAGHPLQLAIKEKINALCGVKTDYPVTKDGCGVPIMSMPLRKILKGYLELFCSYGQIRDAFLNYPYIIGGQNRLDTKIMEHGSGNLIAKVGAGGLCVVVNIECKEGFIVKIADSDMKAREIAVIDTLKNLRWADIPIEREIKTLHGEVVGEMYFSPLEIFKK